VRPSVVDPNVLVVLSTAAVEAVGHLTEPPIFSPLPFLILKLRRKEQPSSAARLRSFTVAALFLGLQDMEDSWVCRSVVECTRINEHLKVFAPALIATLEILVFSEAEDQTIGNKIKINTAASLML